MPRGRRLKVIGDEAYYHIISRTVGQEFYLNEVEKEKLLSIIKRYTRLYFIEVIGFCIMSNHFHLLIKSEPGDNYSDEEILSRLCAFYEKEPFHFKGKIEEYRRKLSDISEYMKCIKQRFTLWYNKMNNRSGYFWGDRFKSVLVEDGDALINTLCYIDLNPIRANIVDRPEDYRWSSIGYFVQSNNRDNFLYTPEMFEVDEREFLSFYRGIVYRAGGIKKSGYGEIEEKVIEFEEKRGFKLAKGEVFNNRVRYFTEGAVLGSKSFILKAYAKFGGLVIKKKERKAHKTELGENIFSLRCLRN